MDELALFAGAGGGILGGQLLGWRTVCAVEWEPYAASVLAARQNEGLLPAFPVWDDVRTFDAGPWRGLVDVISGGFPCQDISISGKGAGIEGAKSGMWQHMARIIGVIRPRYVWLENSPKLLIRGLGRVLGDLAALGYDCRWTLLGADAVGAAHDRERFWLLAKVADAKRQRSGAQEQRRQADRPQAYGPPGWIGRPGWWSSEPDVGRVANGVAPRLDRLRAIGNGQVPLCAAAAWNLLSTED